MQLNWDFLTGLIIGIAGFVFIAAAPRIGTTYNNATDIQMEFDNIYQNFQPQSFTVLTSTPTPGLLKNGEFVIVKTTGTISIFTRVGSSTYSVKLN